jgi:hypothetical protein
MLYVAITLVPPMALWLLFRTIMRLKVTKDAIPKGALLPLWTRCWGYPTLAVGLVFDLCVNVFHGTFVFAELPRELTVSARIKRLCATGTPRRKAVAVLIRDNLLKPYDPSGGHD